MAVKISERLRRAGMVLGILLIPLALLGLHFLIRGEFEKSRNLRATVEATVATRGDLSDFLVLHLDSETGMRGFVLTADEAFLAPYKQALARRAELSASLRRDLAHDPAALAIFTRVLRNSDLKKLLSERNIADTQTGLRDRARARIASGQGKLVMDRIRADIAALDAMQVARLEAVTDQGEGIRGSLEYTISMLLILISLMLAGVAALVGRTSRERQEALDRAQLLNARQTAMFDGAVDGMMLLDGEGDIQRINPSIIRMFGYAEDELIGRHNTVLMDQPYDLPTSKAWLKRVGPAGEHGAGQRQEFTGLRRDGSTFETEVAVSSVPDGGERRYVAAIRDITDFKRAEAMKNEFVSTVSHELRTPLTSIGGSLGLLTAGAVGQLNDKAARLVAIAHSNCERLIRLINDILDIEKIESGKMHFAEDDIDVAELVRRTVVANTAFAQGRAVELVAVDPPCGILVRGDSDRLEQLLTNLVSNAIKHSPEGGEVSVASLLDGKWVRIEVRDRGGGIPADFRDRIFGKFAMADGSDSRARGGTGLGLSIAREIAERHGGSLTFADRDGGGTVFCARLPLLHSDDAPALRQADLPLVLHIDDDWDCLSVMQSAFEERARVMPVATMAAARAAIAEEDLAAVIVDVDMRGEHGLTLVPLVRERHPRAAVVLFSALDEPHDEAAADAVLIKSRSTLQDVVATTLGLIDAARKTPR